MVVKNIALTEELEKHRYRKENVGRVAELNDLKPTAHCHPKRQKTPEEKRAGVLTDMAQDGTTDRELGVTIDVRLPDVVSPFFSWVAGTDHAALKASSLERLHLTLETIVEKKAAVLDKDESLTSTGHGTQV